MEKEKAFWGSIIGFFAVCIIGTVSHFLYGSSGDNWIVGMFTPVNESLWEHLKLLYFPYLFYVIGEYIVYGHNIKGFLFSRTTGVLLGLVSIPLLYYIYTFFTGRSVLTLDILIFIISVAISFYVSFKRIAEDSDVQPIRHIAAIILMVCITLLFWGLTFFPPEAPMFISE